MCELFLLILTIRSPYFVTRVPSAKLRTLIKTRLVFVKSQYFSINIIYRFGGNIATIPISSSNFELEFN